MAKYKVGDKVLVRSDLEKSKEYYMDDGKFAEYVVSQMMKLSGKVVTIKHVGLCYTIEEDMYNWTDKMFEGLAETEFHEFDTVKHSKYGIGTVIEIMSEDKIKVDFDNWHEDFLYINQGNNFYCRRAYLTLVQAYSPK